MIAPVLLSPGSRVEIDPDVVELDPGLQARTGVLEEVVLDYAAKMRDGEVFPPITVVVVDGRNLCPDGWHRVLAARRAGVKVVADVQPGTRLQALRLAVGANEDHGAKRTNADKRRAVEIALATPELERLTDRELAKVCRVSHTYIGSLRRRSESGNVSTQPDPETSGSVTQEVAHRPTDGEIVRATLACLDHGHRGAARLPELRASVEAQLGCALEEADWRNAIARGASQRLWDHTGVISGPNLLGHIESRTKRPVTAPPAADSPIPRSAPISAGGDPEPGGDREDGEQDPDEGPVLPEDPDDPAAQGHRAALEEAAEDEDEDEEPGGVEGTTHRPHGEGVGQPSPAAEKAGSIPAPGTSAFFEQALLREREHCHEESLRARSEGLRLDLERLGGKTTLAKLRRACEGPSKSLIRTDYWHAMLGYGLEANLWVIAGERIWIERPRISALPPDTLPVPTPAVSQAVDEEDERADLPNDERAKNDAYYTPDLHARALVRWLSQHVYAGQDPQRILEPSVGGGAWLRACRDQWPEAHLRAADIDGDAAGLSLADRARVGDFMALDLESADLIVGNPPYGDEDLDRAAARARLVAWIDRSRELAPVVGYLMRSTFLGAMDRLEWWQRRPPTDVIVVLPRPAWEGPGKRATTDRVDSLFVVWRGPVAGATRLHWLDAKEGA